MSYIADLILGAIGDIVGSFIPTTAWKILAILLSIGVLALLVYWGRMFFDVFGPPT